MKKNVKWIFAGFACLLTCFLYAIPTGATTSEEVEEVKEEWYDTHYYPTDLEKKKYNFFEILDIWNPPLDLLLSMPSEELAALMQEHPTMGQISNYYSTDGTQDYTTYFGFAELNSDIFYELLRREDGITCLLEEYRNSGVTEENLKEYVSPTEYFQRWHTETFGCQFIRYYAHLFTQEEYELACQIIEEKKEQYASMSDTFLYYLDLPEIEPPSGEEVGSIRTDYLFPEDIQEREDRLAEALLQMQLKESNLQTQAPETEESDLQTQAPETEESASQTQAPETEEGDSQPEASEMADRDAAGREGDAEGVAPETVEDGSRNKRMTAVGMIAGMVCVAGGAAFICRKKKRN